MSSLIKFYRVSVHEVSLVLPPAMLTQVHFEAAQIEERLASVCAKEASKVFTFLVLTCSVSRDVDTVVKLRLPLRICRDASA